MKRNLAIIGAATGWFAVITQLVLMMNNRVLPVAETLTRFFSYFTILTNILVAVYYSVLATGGDRWYARVQAPGFLTALTVYITVVGSVYQVLLGGLWDPQGTQMLVDELLHSVVPLYTILFWILYEQKAAVSWAQIPRWLIYPLSYLVYILIRGSLSGFYPYPFVDVTQLGYNKVLLNSLWLTGVFTLLSVLFIGIGKMIGRNRPSQTSRND